MCLQHRSRIISDKLRKTVVKHALTQLNDVDKGDIVESFIEVEWEIDEGIVSVILPFIYNDGRDETKILSFPMELFFH